MELWQSPIWDSARRHGFSDDEIRHALRNFIAVADDSGSNDDVTLFLGTKDASGELIEVGLLDTDDGPVVIHAMSGRMHRFRPHQPGE